MFDVSFELDIYYVLAGIGSVASFIFAVYKAKRSADQKQNEVNFDQLHSLYEEQKQLNQELRVRLQTARSELGIYKRRLSECGSRVFDLTGETRYLEQYIEDDERQNP